MSANEKIESEPDSRKSKTDDVKRAARTYYLQELRLPKRAFGIFLTSMALCVFFFLHPFWEQTSGVTKEIFITLTVVVGIHLLDRILLFRDTEDALEKMTSDIAKKSAQDHTTTRQTLTQVTEKELAQVTGKTEKTLNVITGNMAEMIKSVHGETVDVLDRTKSYLQQVSESLAAMTKVGVNRLYSSREQAASDMFKDLITDGPITIRLMGISLNDFVQGSGDFGRAWSALKTRVKREAEAQLHPHKKMGSDSAASAPANGNMTMNIRLLLIHPFCLGAQLRSKGEARGTDAIESRLMTDVQSVANEIEKLQASATGNISIECKLYQLPPTLFLCSVSHGVAPYIKGSIAYMQPYFFWNKRQDIPVPVFKFLLDFAKDLNEQIPHQLNEHFDLIWEKASVTLDDFKHNNIIGVDQGMRQASAINVFLRKSDSRGRILQMLRHAKVDVWIQGISLLSFFSPGDIYQEIIKLILNGNVCLRVLVIDPDGEQAMLRSFRERLFVAKDDNFESYRDSERYKESALYTDTMATISHAIGFMEHLSEARAADSNWVHNVQIRKYKSAPACFILKVDDRVLVEQYHYGKARQSHQPEMDVAILGKEMPVLEFSSSSDDLYESTPEVEERKPFRLLEDHFKFAFANGIDVLPEHILSKCPQRWK